MNLIKFESLQKLNATLLCNEINIKKLYIVIVLNPTNRNIYAYFKCLWFQVKL